jgi:sulfur carrier protein
MQIIINGEAQEIPDGETVRALVGRYNFKPENVAIELNRRLLRAEKYDAVLQPGDQVEIVTFVGGG